MSSRRTIQHYISPTEPTGVQVGDEWCIPSTGKVYKRTLISGVIGWLDISNTTADIQTLSNKRVVPRIQTIANTSLITPTGDTADVCEITSLGIAANVASPSGTPTDGQKLIIRIKDNGVSQNLTWANTAGAYRPIGITLPVSTTATKVTYVGLIYNSQDGYWDAIATTTQA